MVTEKTSLDDSFQEIIKELTQFRIGVTRIQSNIRRLDIQIRKELKKQNKQLKNKKATKPPSGFAKPTTISPELCNFMNKPVGVKAARTEVTQYIIKYIKDKSLQNVNNKKEILPDKDLANLLDCGDNSITYFTIQKYMNKHFIHSDESS